MRTTLTLASLILSLGASLSPQALLAEDAPMTLAVKRLTLDTALTIAKATLQDCSKKGIQIGVTVVDRDGNVQVSLRDSIAAPITTMISRQKAFTAVNFNAKTSALKDRADTPIGRIDGLVMAAGGLPIEVGGQLLGGVGVSGAPGGETDEACAQAGVDAVLEDLELAM